MPRKGADGEGRRGSRRYCVVVDPTASARVSEILLACLFALLNPNAHFNKTPPATCVHSNIREPRPKEDSRDSPTVCTGSALDGTLSDQRIGGQASGSISGSLEGPKNISRRLVLILFPFPKRKGERYRSGLGEWS